MLAGPPEVTAGLAAEEEGRMVATVARAGLWEVAGDSCQARLVVGVGVTVARGAKGRSAATAGARVARAGGWAVPCRGSIRRTRSLG